MSMSMVGKNEWLRLTPLREDGREVLDLRVWKKTETGGMPTKKSMVIDMTMVIPLIISLQKVHKNESSLNAKRTEATHG